MRGVLPLHHEELLRALHQALAPIAEESLVILEAEHGRNPLAPDADASTEERRRLFRLGAAWGWALALGRLLKEHGSSWLRVEWLREPPVDDLLDRVREDLRRYGLPDPIEDQGAGYGLPPATRNRLAYRMGLSAGIAAALRATGVTPDDEQASGN